jgi:hypothetical protein
MPGDQREPNPTAEGQFQSQEILTSIGSNELLGKYTHLEVSAGLFPLQSPLYLLLP